MSMTVFPNGGRAIVDGMKAKFPELAVNEDEKQRQLTKKIGEQFVHSYGPAWGNKKRTGLGDEFQSKDSMAVVELDGTISVWDMFQGNADVTVLVNDGDLPSHPNLPTSEAAFMPRQPVDHLGTQPDPPPDPDPPSDPDPELPPDFVALLREVKGLRRDIKALNGKLDRKLNVSGTAKVPYLGEAPISGTIEPQV